LEQPAIASFEGATTVLSKTLAIDPMDDRKGFSLATFKHDAVTEQCRARKRTKKRSRLNSLSPPRSLDHSAVRAITRCSTLSQRRLGIVVRAFEEMLHRVVADKILAPQLALTSPARKRFRAEARASARVRHRNVV
jgi:hypothetical protein